MQCTVPSIASTLDVGLAARVPHPSEAPSQHASTAAADRKPKRTYSTNLDDLTSSSPAKPAGGATANEAATAAFAAKLAAALHDETDTAAVARSGQRAVSSVKGLSADAAAAMQGGEGAGAGGDGGAVKSNKIIEPAQRQSPVASSEYVITAEAALR
ncbi:hypothetical protein JKP88DRAFT_282866 [Tribonema minus]|uniref:Uncharacterized protein n=1 Tax=Tribonema minus TaxID=303371 RepID=A0A835YJK2_9STRA|nr:hypothetical protein JKP88DRAFT_282866 [Tribonema minus]